MNHDGKFLNLLEVVIEVRWRNPLTAHTHQEYISELNQVEVWRMQAHTLIDVIEKADHSAIILISKEERR